MIRYLLYTYSLKIQIYLPVVVLPQPYHQRFNELQYKYIIFSFTFMQKNILITGEPKSWKTTLLKSIIIPYQHLVWFVTDEIRENNQRIWFSITTNTWAQTILATTTTNTAYKVGKFYAQPDNLETLIPQLIQFSENDILYIDEIGPMELLSPSFPVLVETYLNASNPCIATISNVYHDAFTEKIRQRNDIHLIEITEENRNEIWAYISKLFANI